MIRGLGCRKVETDSFQSAINDLRKENEYEV